VSRRLERLATLAADGGLYTAIGLMSRHRGGAVVQAFGTGHSRPSPWRLPPGGGLIPTNKIALRDLVLHGTLTVDALGGSTSAQPDVVSELWRSR
jgi:hypothetical protein